MRILKLIWNYWKRFGRFIATIVSYIISILVYIIIITPFGIIVRFSSDYLRIKNLKDSSWINLSSKNKNIKIEDLRREY